MIYFIQQQIDWYNEQSRKFQQFQMDYIRLNKHAWLRKWKEEMDELLDLQEKAWIRRRKDVGDNFILPGSLPVWDMTPEKQGFIDRIWGIRRS